jgi:hypothetical protein
VRRLRDLAVLGLLLTVSWCAIAAPPARGVPFTVIDINGEPQVRLAPPLARAVKRGFAEYRLPRSADEDPQMRVLCRETHPEIQVACAAWGDFNGDGLKDAALHLRRPRSRDAGIVVVFHATRAGPYQAHVLDRWQRTGAQFCVARVKPGAISYVRDGGTARKSPAVLRLRHDGIELLLPGVASRLYYWDGKRYISVATSD